MNVLRLITAFTHFRNFDTSSKYQRQRSTSSGEVSDRSDDDHNENDNIMVVHGIGVDNECTSIDDQENDTAHSMDGQTSNEATTLSPTSSTIDIQKLPILIRAQVNDRNVNGRSCNPIPPKDLLKQVIDIYFDYVDELAKIRKMKRSIMMKKNSDNSESNSKQLSITSSVQSIKSSGSITDNIGSVGGSSPKTSTKAITASTTTGPAGLGLAPAPLLSYVYKRYISLMNGVKSLGEYKSSEFLLNVLSYYKTIALKVEKDNDLQLYTSSNNGTTDDPKKLKKKISKKQQSIDKERKKQEAKDKKRLGLFCRMTGIIGGLKNAMSPGATRFVLAGLFEASDYGKKLFRLLFSHKMLNTYSFPTPQKKTLTFQEILCCTNWNIHTIHTTIHHPHQPLNMKMKIIKNRVQDLILQYMIKFLLIVVL
jgi:hypothetical protein